LRKVVLRKLMGGWGKVEKISSEEVDGRLGKS